MVHLPAYPAAVLAAIRAAEVSGRLPAPTADTLGDIFPFEPAVTVVPVAEPVLPEPPRFGEDPAQCGGCQQADSEFCWTNVRWRLASITAQQSLGVHGFMLKPRAHLDLADLDDDLAAEQGRLLVAIERAIVAGIDGVGRVHVIRWGDGGAHLHWWFLARPIGVLQLRGSHLASWLDVLPPLPAELVAADVAAVARQLQDAVGGSI